MPRGIPGTIQRRRTTIVYLGLFPGQRHGRAQVCPVPQTDLRERKTMTRRQALKALDRCKASDKRTSEGSLTQADVLGIVRQAVASYEEGELPDVVTENVLEVTRKRWKG